MSTEVHTLSGAYALDALEAREAADFETHLEHCAACREEVAELQDAAASMAEVEALAPPPSLRAAVLAAADRTPQLPPVPTGTPVAGTGTLAAPTPLRRPGAVTRTLMSAAAVAALVVGGVVVVDQIRGEQQLPLASGVVRVFDAEDARVVTARTSNGAEVRVAMSEGAGRMAVDTSTLPDLGDEQVYQLWTIVDGEPQSAAVLEDPHTGAAMRAPLPTSQVAITIEPYGGSESPTTDPIVLLEVSDV